VRACEAEFVRAVWCWGALGVGREIAENARLWGTIGDFTKRSEFRFVSSRKCDSVHCFFSFHLKVRNQDLGSQRAQRKPLRAWEAEFVRAVWCWGACGLGESSQRTPAFGEQLAILRNAANLGSFRRESVILCIASFPSIWSLNFRFADFQMPDFKNRVKRLNVAVGQAVAVARKSLGIFLGTGS
jgi:hypothetical protein